MKFEEILPALREGKFVRRKSWEQPWMKKLQEHMWYEPLKYSNGFTLRRLFGDNRLLADDLEANDWEIYSRVSD